MNKLTVIKWLAVLAGLVLTFFTVKGIFMLADYAHQSREAIKARMMNVEYCFIRLSYHSPMREKVIFIEFESMVNRTYFKYKGIDSDGNEVLVGADINECKDGTPAGGANPRS